jgi:GH25 family lysozyme M1 (1,4-beta-N-acetylmuramidase)
VNGIDVSKYQKRIDWAKVDASGIDFALVRIGMGNDAKQIDPFFRTNVTQALAHGLHVGGYYFGYATSIADARKEADVCNQLLQPYKGKLLFPVAYDYEYDSVDYFKREKGRTLTNEEIDSFACAFCDRLNSYGWFVNLYTNLDFYRSGSFQTAVTKYDVWLADYSGGPDYPCYIQQTGSKGRIPGISGNVDLDESFRDYPTMIRAGGYNGYPRPAQTAVQIDTTQDIAFRPGEMYTVRTASGQMPELYAGTDNVVLVKHCRREMSYDYWHLIFTGKSGTAAGIFTRLPGETPVKRFVARVA